MIKLIAFDFDGTILDRGKFVKELKPAFKYLKEKGIILVPTTGRSMKSIIPHLKEIDLYNEENYALLITGAIIQKIKTNDVIFETVLGYKDYEYIKSVVKDEENIAITIYTKDTLIYENRITPEFASDASDLEDDIQKFDIKRHKNLDYARINIMAKKEILDKIEEKYIKIFNKKYYCVRNIPTSLEIFNKNVSKGNAVKELANMLNIDMDSVLCIGDGNNDISMFNVTKNSVVMGNARNTVKEHANYVVGRVENAGFKDIIELFNI